MFRKDHIKLNLGLIIFLLIVTVLSMLIADTRPATLSLPDDSQLLRLVIFDIRLPRVLLTLVTGATLGLAGAVLQGLLRNPLVEPGIIGTSGGAALAAAIIFHFELVKINSLLLPLGGIAGAIITMLLLYVLAGKGGQLYRLILAGIAINTCTTALTTLALNLAPNPFALSEILFWLMGSASKGTMLQVWSVLPFVIIGCFLMLTTGKGLAALTLGEKSAASMGVRIGRLKLKVILGAGIAVGACVSVTGSIGFVGLVVPHILRRYVGNHPGALLWPGAIAGAALLVLADILVRVIPTGNELKLGVITAILGVPFFIYLVLDRRYLNRDS